MGELRMVGIVTGKFIFWQLVNHKNLKRAFRSGIVETTVGDGFLQMVFLYTVLFSQVGNGARDF